MNLKSVGVLGLLLAFTSCVSVRQIGKVNMMSTRNVDPSLRYKVLSTYVGRSTLTASKAETIEDAVNATVRSVPGGEFLMNVKLYSVDEGKYFGVEGDVWGAEDASFRGFRAGDRVTFKNPAIFTTKKYLTGTVASLKTDQVCLVAPDEAPSDLLEVSYDDLAKGAPRPSGKREPAVEPAEARRRSPLQNAQPTGEDRVQPTQVAPNEMVTSLCTAKQVTEMRAAGMSDRAINEACRPAP